MPPGNKHKMKWTAKIRFFIVIAKEEKGEIKRAKDKAFAVKGFFTPITGLKGFRECYFFLLGHGESSIARKIVCFYYSSNIED